MECPNCDKEIDNGLTSWVKHQEDCDHSVVSDYTGFELYMGSELHREFEKVLKEELKRLKEK